VVTPVDHPELRKELRQMLDIQLNDQRSGWDMQPDGDYVQRQPRTEAEQVGSQQRLIELATERVKKATKYPKRRGVPRLGGRNLR
jgi:polyphosphate kinase